MQDVLEVVEAQDMKLWEPNEEVSCYAGCDAVDWFASHLRAPEATTYLIDPATILVDLPKHFCPSIFISQTASPCEFLHFFGPATVDVLNKQSLLAFKSAQLWDVNWKIEAALSSLGIHMRHRISANYGRLAWWKLRFLMLFINWYKNLTFIFFLFLTEWYFSP